MSDPSLQQNFGPLEPLLRDPDVTEILVDGPYRIYVEKHHRFVDVAEVFRDEAHLMQIIDMIVAPTGSVINESNPILDVRLSDDSRIHIVIPPIALDGPYMVIAKFRNRMLTVEELINYSSWNEDIVTFLRACVASHINIAIAGGTGSGKTTVFNILADMIDDDERILVVQDSSDLQFKKKRMIRQETRPANFQGRGAVTLEDLMVSTIKMRPDRILLSEARGPEVIHLFAAMNTGHNGTMFSIHANNPRDTIARLEVMATMSDLSIPILAIREQMASALDLIVQIGRLPDGSRKVLKVTEIAGMTGDVILMQDIFEFRQTGRDANGQIQGVFSATGHIPRLLSKIRDAGIELPMKLFTPR